MSSIGGLLALRSLCRIPCSTWALLSITDTKIRTWSEVSF